MGDDNKITTTAGTVEVLKLSEFANLVPVKTANVVVKEENTTAEYNEFKGYVYDDDQSNYDALYERRGQLMKKYENKGECVGDALLSCDAFVELDLTDKKSFHEVIEEVAVTSIMKYGTPTHIVVVDNKVFALRNRDEDICIRYVTDEKTLELLSACIIYTPAQYAVATINPDIIPEEL